MSKKAIIAAVAVGGVALAAIGGAEYKNAKVKEAIADGYKEQSITYDSLQCNGFINTQCTARYVTTPTKPIGNGKMIPKTTFQKMTLSGDTGLYSLVLPNGKGSFNIEINGLPLEHENNTYLQFSDMAKQKIGPALAKELEAALEGLKMSAKMHFEQVDGRVISVRAKDVFMGFKETGVFGSIDLSKGVINSLSLGVDFDNYSLVGKIASTVPASRYVRGVEVLQLGQNILKDIGEDGENRFLARIKTILNNANKTGFDIDKPAYLEALSQWEHTNNLEITKTAVMLSLTPTDNFDRYGLYQKKLISTVVNGIAAGKSKFTGSFKNLNMTPAQIGATYIMSRGRQNDMAKTMAEGMEIKFAALD